MWAVADLHSKILDTPPHLGVQILSSENGNIFSSKLKSLKPSEMLYLSDEKYSLFIYKYI